MEVSWNLSWEPEELLNTCESFKQSLNKFEEHIAAPNLSQPAPDEHLNDLQKQGIPAVELKGVLFTDRIMETNR